MNNLMIFRNDDFKEIRTIKEKDIVWFVGKDIAINLGYQRPDNAIRNHVDNEDKLMHQISASGQKREMVLINESGLYSLVLSSKLEKAKKFKRWVTSEVLPQIRKTGIYKPSVEELIIMQAKSVKEVKEQLNQVNFRALKVQSEIEKLPLLAADSDELKTVANRKIVSLLGGKKAPAYKTYNRKAFSDLYHEIHRNFDVRKLCAIKRKDLDLVKDVITHYELPLKLREEIEFCNKEFYLG